MTNRRILIANHDQRVSNELSSFLRRSGYDVSLACNSDDAIRVAKNDPALLIIDPVMPGLSGLEAANHIFAATGCKVLFLTDLAGDEDFQALVDGLVRDGIDCAAFATNRPNADLVAYIQAAIGVGSPAEPLTTSSSTQSPERPPDRSEGANDVAPTGQIQASPYTPLFAVANAKLYQSNAFRLTGLQVSATSREIKRAYQEFGMSKSLNRAWKPKCLISSAVEPDDDDLEAAFALISDPEKRLLQDFFWFWPDGAEDSAFASLAANDSALALAEWGRRSIGDDPRGIATHNLAVFSHLRALEGETSGISGQTISATTLWGDAFRHWQTVATNSRFWDHYIQRIKEMNDPRITPELARSMWRTLLGEAKLSAGHIERTILVGGPTYTPFLREILADPKEGLGIPVDFSADPLTVVAQGAAIFAGSRRLPARRPTPTAAGTFTVALTYDPIGSDLEPLVGGTVLAPSGKSLSGYTIRFNNPGGTPPWDSGKIPLDDAGTFSGFLLAQSGSANEYHVELFDQSGRACSVTPSVFTYTVGLTITKPPLTHNIGIAEAGNRVHVLFAKGTPLPAKATAKHVTIGLIRRGNRDDALRVPLIEGEATDAADENRKIGEFVLTGSMIDRDLPSGSGVEIRLAIDDSRTIKASVYIPILDLEKEVSINGLIKPALPIGEIEQEFRTERNALNESQELAEAVKSKPALIELESMKRQEVVQGIQNLLQHGGTDADLKSCEEQLVALRRARRRIEVILTAPKMQQEAQDELRWTQALLEEVGTDENRAKFIDLKRNTELALTADPEILRKAIDALATQRIELWLRTPEYWLGYREYLAGEKAKMTDETQADRWLVHADRAIASGDTEALKVACRQLNALLPRDVQTVGYGGSTLRAR